MTGQVKEDILSRFAELGVHIDDGCLTFRFDLFDETELLTESTEFQFCDLEGESRSVTVPSGAYAFTLCQVPIVCQPGDKEIIRIEFADGQTQTNKGLQLDASHSKKLLLRLGEIVELRVSFQTGSQ